MTKQIQSQGISRRLFIGAGTAAASRQLGAGQAAAQPAREGEEEAELTDIPDQPTRGA